MNSTYKDNNDERLYFWIDKSKLDLSIYPEFNELNQKNEVQYIFLGYLVSAIHSKLNYRINSVDYNKYIPKEALISIKNNLNSIYLDNLFKLKSISCFDNILNIENRLSLNKFSHNIGDFILTLYDISNNKEDCNFENLINNYCQNNVIRSKNTYQINSNLIYEIRTLLTNQFYILNTKEKLFLYTTEFYNIYEGNKNLSLNFNSVTNTTCYFNKYIENEKSIDLAKLIYKSENVSNMQNMNYLRHCLLCLSSFSKYYQVDNYIIVDALHNAFLLLETLFSSSIVSDKDNFNIISIEYFANISVKITSDVNTNNIMSGELKLNSLENIYFDYSNLTYLKLINNNNLKLGDYCFENVHNIFGYFGLSKIQIYSINNMFKLLETFNCLLIDIDKCYNLEDYKHVVEIFNYKIINLFEFEKDNISCYNLLNIFKFSYDKYENNIKIKEIMSNILQVTFNYVYTILNKFLLNLTKPYINNLNNNNIHDIKICNSKTLLLNNYYTHYKNNINDKSSSTVYEDKNIELLLKDKNYFNIISNKKNYQEYIFNQIYLKNFTKRYGGINIINKIPFPEIKTNPCKEAYDLIDMILTVIKSFVNRIMHINDNSKETKQSFKYKAYNYYIDIFKQVEKDYFNLYFNKNSFLRNTNDLNVCLNNSNNLNYYILNISEFIIKKRYNFNVLYELNDILSINQYLNKQTMLHEGPCLYYYNKYKKLSILENIPIHQYNSNKDKLEVIFERLKINKYSYITFRLSNSDYIKFDHDVYCILEDYLFKFKEKYCKIKIQKIISVFMMFRIKSIVFRLKLFQIKIKYAYRRYIKRFKEINNCFDRVSMNYTIKNNHGKYSNNINSVIDSKIKYFVDSLLDKSEVRITDKEKIYKLTQLNSINKINLKTKLPKKNISSDFQYNNNSSVINNKKTENLNASNKKSHEYKNYKFMKIPNFVFKFVDKIIQKSDLSIRSNNKLYKNYQYIFANENKNAKINKQEQTINVGLTVQNYLNKAELKKNSIIADLMFLNNTKKDTNKKSIIGCYVDNLLINSEIKSRKSDVLFLAYKKLVPNFIDKILRSACINYNAKIILSNGFKYNKLLFDIDKKTINNNENSIFASPKKSPIKKTKFIKSNEITNNFSPIKGKTSVKRSFTKENSNKTSIKKNISKENLAESMLNKSNISQLKISNSNKSEIKFTERLGNNKAKSPAKENVNLHSDTIYNNNNKISLNNSINNNVKNINTNAEVINNSLIINESNELNSNIYNKLNELLKSNKIKKINISVYKIQSYFKGYKLRYLIKLFRHSATIIQRNLRKYFILKYKLPNNYYFNENYLNFLNIKYRNKHHYNCKILFPLQFSEEYCNNLKEKLYNIYSTIKNLNNSHDQKQKEFNKLVNLTAKEYNFNSNRLISYLLSIYSFLSKSKFTNNINNSLINYRIPESKTINNSETINFYTKLIDIELLVDTDSSDEFNFAEDFMSIYDYNLNVNNQSNTNITTIKDICLGGYHCLVLNNKGKLFSFGWNAFNQCGINSLNSLKNVFEKDNYLVDVNNNNELIIQNINHVTSAYSYSDKDTLDKNYYSNYNNVLFNYSVDDKSNQLALSNVNIVRFDDCINVVNISCGEEHSIVLDDTGSIWSFGNNCNGQLGLSHTQEIEKPTKLIVLKELTKQKSKLSCNFNYNNQNNENCYSDKSEITFKQILSKDNVNFALSSNDDLYMWPTINKDNSINSYPKLIRLNSSINNKLNNSISIQYSNKIELFSCGSNFVIIQTINGLLYSFGKSNTFGQLGHGNTKPVSRPTIIKYFLDNKIKIQQVSAGHKHVLARSSTFKAYSWGLGSKGQLGIGNYSDSYYPQIINYFNNEKISQVSAGFNCSYFLLSETRKIYSCGGSSCAYIPNFKKDIIYKCPELSSEYKYSIVKLNTSWNKIYSILYVVIADTSLIRVKEMKKVNNILNNLSCKWTNNNGKIKI